MVDGDEPDACKKGEARTGHSRGMGYVPIAFFEAAS
jgi:hypothetical protein